MVFETVHIPVLFHEVLAGLKVGPGRCYIDGTVGAGGHAWGILAASGPDGRLLGIDLDPAALSLARKRLAEFEERVILLEGNFAQMENLATRHGFQKVDGILLDLGVSSEQLEDGERGFSFQKEGPLDMRFGREGKTAAELINTLKEKEIAEILWRYGEERKARQIARAIVANRPVRSTKELAEIVAQATGRRGRIHPATRTFQALRIAVNDELGALSKALPQAVRLLAPGGRLAVISFHSLEDRLVKEFLRRESQDCLCPPELPVCLCQHRASLKILTKKPIRPSPEERQKNPRSRSARLRLASRLPSEN